MFPLSKTLVSAAGGESRPVTAIPNANTNTLSWSPDGTFLVFNTSQRTEDTEVVRVDLTPRTPKFAEDQFRDLFKDEPARGAPSTSSGQGGAGAGGGRAAGAAAPRPEPKPVEIDFTEIRRRVSTLSLGTNYTAQGISPDGKWLLASGGGNDSEGSRDRRLEAADCRRRRLSHPRRRRREARQGLAHRPKDKQPERRTDGGYPRPQP